LLILKDLEVEMSTSNVIYTANVRE